MARYILKLFQFLKVTKIIVKIQKYINSHTFSDGLDIVNAIAHYFKSSYRYLNVNVNTNCDMYDQKPYLLIEMSFIFLLKGSYPNIWKSAFVTPINKSGDKRLMSNTLKNVE